MASLAFRVEQAVGTHGNAPSDAGKVKNMTTSDIVLLHMREHETLLRRQPEAAPDTQAEVHTLPLGQAALFATLRHDPPTPLELEVAIEQIEEALMPALDRVTGAARLVFVNAALYAMARAESATGILPVPSAVDLTLDIDTIERLLNRLADRSAGRPQTQDSLPTDAASSAALLVAREALHHWGFRAITLRA